MIREILTKLAKGLPLNSQEQSVLNNLENVGNQVSGMTLPGTSGVHLKAPTLSNPTWGTSPLHMFEANMETDLTTVNDTHKKVTFDYSAGEVGLFDFYGGDKSKIKIDMNQYNVSIVGAIVWTSNNTGYRNCQLRTFDKDANSLGNLNLHNLPPANGIDSVLPVLYRGDFRSFLPTLAYVEFWVKQNTGADLVVKNLQLSMSVA